MAALIVSSACARNTVAVAPSSSPSIAIDTLDFVIGDESLWPRIGTQRQHQIVDRERREVCWVKYGDARKFECWRWDDRWIYHEVDHALDGDRTGRSYSFSDGRWLPRHLSGEWSLDLRSNRAIDYTPDCRTSERPFPYRMRAHLEPAQDLGGDLGTRPVLVLEYQPYAPGERATPDTIERYSFAQGAGWYLWESVRGSARFDRLRRARSDAYASVHRSTSRTALTPAPAAGAAAAPR